MVGKIMYVYHEKHLHFPRNSKMTKKWSSFNGDVNIKYLEKNYIKTLHISFYKQWGFGFS